MAKKAAAQNGRADLPVSQDVQQRDCDWHASHYLKVMHDQIFENRFVAN
jgi:predicted NACHT family NTPase